MSAKSNRVRGFWTQSNKWSKPKVEEVDPSNITFDFTSLLHY